MTLATNRKIVILATLGALLLPVIACSGSSSSRASSSPSSITSSPELAATPGAKARQEQRIAFLIQRSEGDPLDVFSLNSLATEYMQRARETGDVSDLSRAEDALTRSNTIRPTGNYDGVALLAAISTIKHDFARGLDLATSAIALKPKEAYGYGVLGDAQMGLGDYEAADVAYEKMVTLSPDLSAFGRRALLFQVRGNVAEAESSWKDAIRLAEQPDDGVPEHAAWTHTQLAALYFATGRIDDASDNYDTALRSMPGYVHALAGQGRVAAARGDLSTAIERYTAAINRVPLPEYVTALGDVYAANGDAKRAQDQYELIGAIEQLYAVNGVNLDLQIGLFNADHDRDIAATAVRAKAAFAQQPSIQAADMLAWVQYKAGNISDARTAIESALRTGTKDPLINFHAGMIYRAAGDDVTATQHLKLVEDSAPAFSILYAAMARSALAELEFHPS